MAEDLEPIRQVVNIDVKESGADKATSDMDKLDVSIKDTTKSLSDNTKENKKSEESFKSLKTQLKEAIVAQQKLSQQFGATSAEATKAAKAVAGIKDEIGLQKDLVDSYNPDDKFRGLSQTAGIAALALGGVKDGLAAIGIESEGLDKVIGTAQAILGVTGALGGMTDAYEILTASKKAKTAAEVVEIGTTEALAVAEGEATVATWSFNAALLANPIVAITAAIVAAGVAIYAYIKITGDAATAEEKAKVASMQLTQAIEYQSKSFERNSKELSDLNNHKLALLKASGATETQIYKETEALKAQEVQLAQNNRNELERLEQKAYALDKANSTDVTQANLKLAQDNLKAANDLILKQFDEADKLRDDHEVAVRQAETDAREKREADLKAANEKAKAEAERVAKEKLEAHKKELADINAVADENASFIAKSKIKQDEEKALKDAEAEEKRKQKLADDIQQSADNAESQKRIDDALLQNKLNNQQQLVDSGEQLIKNVASLAGKNKAIQKAAIVAEGGVSVGKAVANTAEAVTKDLAKGFPFSAPLVALDLAVGATSIASIVKGTSQALKAVGGGSAPTASGQTNAPSRNVAQVGFQASSENQISTAINQQQKDQPPIEAFVVSQSVRDADELARKKELNNSF